MALESTHSLTEMSTRNLPGCTGQPARKADNLTAICEPIFWKMWEPRRLPTLWASTACYRDSFSFDRLIFCSPQLDYMACGVVGMMNWRGFGGKQWWPSVIWETSDEKPVLLSGARNLAQVYVISASELLFYMIPPARVFYIIVACRPVAIRQPFLGNGPNSFVTHTHGVCYKQDKSEVLLVGIESPTSKGVNTSWGSYGVGSRYQATTDEDIAEWEDLVRAVVKCKVCELGIML
jgi:hypothetical protein